MAKRNISQADVEAVLAAPEMSYPSGTSSRHIYVRNISGRRIAAVVDPVDHELVITAYDQLSTS